MIQVYPDAALVPLLERIVADGVRYHLFTNDITPDADTELIDFIEATWEDYASVLVDGADFSLNGVTANRGTILAAPISIEQTGVGTNSAYGYYVTDSGSTVLLAAARFDSAPVNKDQGEHWVITPIFGDFDGNAA